jgi:hypothetical protein
MESLRNSEETLIHLVNHGLPEYGYLSTLLVKDAPPQYDDYCDFGEIFQSTVEAPYSTPCANGVPIYAEKAKFSRFKIPYVKMMDVVTACDAMEAYMVVNGKILTKSFSARDDLEKLNLAIFARAEAHKRAIGLLKERQAFNFFASGTGDYRSAFANGQLLDFGRDQILKNVVFAPENKWDYTNGTILNSLVAANEILEEFGFTLKHIVANNRTIKHVLNHPQILKMAKHCCNNQKNPMEDLKNPFFFGGKSKEIGDFIFHTYNPRTKKIDVSGGEPKHQLGDAFLPDGMAIFIGHDGQEDVPVRMFHGKIKSLSAIRSGQSSQKIHTKVLEESDMEKVVTQSAPMVAGNANCAFMARVLI